VVWLRGCCLPGLRSSKGRQPSSHSCRSFPALRHPIYGSCVPWRTRKVISGDDDWPSGPPAFYGHDRISLRATTNVERVGDIHRLPGTRSSGEKKEKVMRMQKHGDPPCGHLWRQVRLRIALRPFVAMSSVLPVHRYCRRCGWDITALEEPQGGTVPRTPRLLTAPTLPTLPLRRPLAGHRSKVACERVGGGLHSH
jgi:hypothetical protein